MCVGGRHSKLCHMQCNFVNIYLVLCKKIETIFDIMNLFMKLLIHLVLKPDKWLFGEPYSIQLANQIFTLDENNLLIITV